MKVTTREIEPDFTPFIIEIEIKSLEDLNTFHSCFVGQSREKLEENAFDEDVSVSFKLAQDFYQSIKSLCIEKFKTK